MNLVHVQYVFIKMKRNKKLLCFIVYIHNNDNNQYNNTDKQAHNIN